MTFFLTLLFMGMVFWRPQDWLFPVLYGWPILDVVIFIALLTLFVELRMGRIQPPRVIQAKLLFGLWITAMLSHIARTFFAMTITTFVEVGKICLFSLLFISVLDSERRIRLVAGTIVGMTLLMAVHALMQARLGYGFAGGSPLRLRGPDGTLIVRSQFFGIFADPNDLAQIMTVGIPLTFAVAYRRNLLTTAVELVVVAMLIAAVLTTHSRGGLLALATVFAASVIVFGFRGWGPPVAILTLALIIPVAGRFAAGWMDISAHNRVVQWGFANHVFKQHPIFGIGYGMYTEVVSGLVAHNAFVTCYTELGIVGYWFWFGLIALGFTGCWRVNRLTTSPYLRRMARLCIVALAGFCASAYFLTRTWGYPLFFMTALAAGVVRVEEDRTKQENAIDSIGHRCHDLASVSIGSVASIAYIYVSVLVLNAVAG